MKNYNLGQGFSAVLKAILMVPLFILQEVVRAIALIGDYIFKNLADIFLSFNSKENKNAKVTIPVLGDLIPYIFGGIAKGFNKVATAKGFPMVINPPKPSRKGSQPQLQPPLTRSKPQPRLADTPEAIKAPYNNQTQGDWAGKVQKPENPEQSVLKSA